MPSPGHPPGPPLAALQSLWAANRHGREFHPGPGVSLGDWYALRYNPDYKADCRARGDAPSVVESAGSALHAQTEADIEATRWGLLAREDPRSRKWRKQFLRNRSNTIRGCSASNLTLVDLSPTMADRVGIREESMAARESTTVVGIRLPEKVAVAFKMAAAQRNVRLNELFQEMWELYLKARGEDGTNDGR